MTSFSSLASRDTNWISVKSNDLRLVSNPDDRLAALTDLIETAEQSLRLFYYMFEGDEIGHVVRGHLLAACQRGVAVELIVDSFGSNGAPKGFFDPLIAVGARFSIFSPRFSTSYFVRNHQKFIIADKARAMIGGFNIADQYFDNHELDQDSDDNPRGWEDLGLVIHGPQVERLNDYFAALSRWVRESNGNMRSLRKMVRQWDAGDGTFRWLLGGPSNLLSAWARSIKQDLENGHRLSLVSAYFSPGQGLLRRIAGIAKRGGESRLLLPSKSDNNATIGASRLLYNYLLKRGTHVHEYQPKRLHAKLVVVDNAVYVGSANFDLRSLFINVEMMLRIEDDAFAERACELVDALTSDSEEITLKLHRSRRSLLNRLRWALSYFVVNILDYTVSRRLNFGIKK